MPTSSRGSVPVARSAEVGTTPLRVLDNLHSALERAWHPVALSRELKAGGWLQVRLLGRTWLLRRTDDGVVPDPPAYGVRERLGVVWVAPEQPLDRPLEVPELADRRFLSGWLPPLRSSGSAATLVDALLDGAHVARPSSRELPPPSLMEEPAGFTGVTEGDGVRATATFRAPFQLRIRAEETATGAASTVVFMLQPEDADSTRVFTRLLLSAATGRPLPAPGEVVQQMAEVHARLEAEARLMADRRGPGLPLDVPEDLHVPAGPLGFALRRALSDFTVAGRAPDAA